MGIQSVDTKAGAAATPTLSRKSEGLRKGVGVPVPSSSSPRPTPDLEGGEAAPPADGFEIFGAGNFSIIVELETTFDVAGGLSGHAGQATGRAAGTQGGATPQEEEDDTPLGE